MNLTEEQIVKDTPLVLEANSLLSKWGFGDGDQIVDWIYEVFDSWAIDYIDYRKILVDLVHAKLVPALSLAGHDFEIVEIICIHNPIRIETLDGEDVNHYEMDQDRLPGIEVTLTPEEFIEFCKSRKGE